MAKRACYYCVSCGSPRFSDWCRTCRGQCLYLGDRLPSYVTPSTVGVGRAIVLVVVMVLVALVIALV